MMGASVTIRLALRDWDYLTPLLLGEVRSERFDVQITRVGTLLPSVEGQHAFDGAELSFSGYVRRRARGNRGEYGVPYFLMRGFRHRCILVRQDATLGRIADLAGRRIGVTGWPDSGNSWTRALLRREGVDLEQVSWYAGRLTDAHPVVDRLSGFGRPGWLEAAPDERSLMSLLADGFLDAVFTPFLPAGFYDSGSAFRHLLSDYRTHELTYYREVGYVPGMHLLVLSPDIVSRHPDLPAELCCLLARAKALWLAKRFKYADTTPWVLDDFATIARNLRPEWDDGGVEINRTMIADFLAELHVQNILAEPMDVSDIFP